ncbi:MAG: NAD(P)H-binding protein [Flavobacteriales bacterium]
MKTAIILGSSGLVGTALLQQLIKDDSYSNIKILVRKPSEIKHSKIEEIIVDFKNIESYKQLVVGDILFSCMGTTLQNAKSKATQYEVDFTYQFQTAKAAAENGVKEYVLISSIGASAKSNNFYLRMKGELEEAVRSLPFKQINIMRPGPLGGNRKEFRLGEALSFPILKFFNALGLFKKYRIIDVEIVAKAMINSTKQNQNKWNIYESNEMFTM